MVDVGLERESPRTPNQLCRIDSEKTCRICFEPENLQDQLIVPCECSGSIKFVHEKCLKKAILAKSRRLDSVSCEICKKDLQMEVKFSLKFNCRLKNEGFCKLFMLSVLSCIMSTIIILITLYLSTPSSSKSSISDFALFFLFYKTCRLSCFILNVSKWKIFPSEKAEPLEVTHVSDCLELKENQEGLQPAVLKPELFVRCNDENSEETENNRERIDSSITEACQLTPRLGKAG